MSVVFWWAQSAAQAASITACLWAGISWPRASRPTGAELLAGIFCCLLCAFLPTTFTTAAAETAVAAGSLMFGQHVSLRAALLTAFFVTAVTHFWIYTAAVLPTGVGLAITLILTAVLLILAASLAHWPSASRRIVDAAAKGAAIIGIITPALLAQLAPAGILENTLPTWIVINTVLAAIVLLRQSHARLTLAMELAEHQRREQNAAKQHYHDLEEIIRCNATLYHDMRHHLAALESSLAAGDTAAALAYVRELQQKDTATSARYTGDTVLDGVIAAKTAAAAKIMDVCIDCAMPQDHIVRPSDLISVVGNLLDNAVQAAQKTADLSAAFVELTIRPVGNMLIIRTRNTGAPGQGMPEPVSALRAHMHGWGLRSVEDTAGRYDGALRSWMDGEIHCVAVALRFAAGPAPSAGAS